MLDILLQADKTKRELLLAFWEIYRFHDIPEMTVTEVAKRAGYGRTTFYNYFSNLPDALAAIETEMYEYQSRNIPKAVDFFINEFRPEQAEMIYNFLKTGSEITYFMTAEDYKKQFLIKFLDNELTVIQNCCLTRKRPAPSDHTLAYLLYGSRTVVLMNVRRGSPESPETIVRWIHKLNRLGPLVASLGD